MRTIQINLYKFDELSEQAKTKARERFLEGYPYRYWYFPIVNEAETIGLTITKFCLNDMTAQGILNLSANEVATNILNSYENDCEVYRIAEEFMTRQGDRKATYRLQDNLVTAYLRLLDERYNHLTSYAYVEKLLKIKHCYYTVDGEKIVNDENSIRITLSPSEAMDLLIWNREESEKSMRLTDLADPCDS